MEISTPLIALLGSLVGGVVSSVLTHALTTRRFYSQKWWERKAEVYSTILEALADIVAANENILRGAQVDKNAKELIRDRFQNAKFRVDQLRHGGSFVMSDEVAKHLQDLDLKRRDINKRIPTFGPGVVKKYFDADSAAVAIAINDIRACGKRELQGRSCWKRLLRD